MTRFVVGLTGGIGSGKTAVSNRFLAKNITVADADIAAGSVVAKGTETLEIIRNRLGDDIIDSTGELDRPKMRTLVFGNPDIRQWLESITHGPIMNLLRQTLADASSPYALLVLSAGTGRTPLINRMLVVDAPLELQKQRVAARDHSAPETIDAIIAAQPTRAARLALADDIIDNSGLPTALDKQVETLHQQYLRFADYD